MVLRCAAMALKGLLGLVCDPVRVWSEVPVRKEMLPVRSMP